jgi:hypothetical protein
MSKRYICTRTFLGIIMLLTTMTGCHIVIIKKIPIVNVPLEIETVTTPCVAARGELQSPDIRMNGYALDVLPFACI